MAISKEPVNPEIDPGFGADTEQKRVEFAAQMEQETYDKAIEDALKMARLNLISALRILSNNNHSKLVSMLSLREIIIIWRIYELVLVSNVFNILSNVESAKILKSVEELKIFIGIILEIDDKAMKKKYQNYDLNLNVLIKIRNDLGGPLVFSLRKKTFEELFKIYKNNSSRLSQSMREEMLDIFNGLEIKLVEINEILLKAIELKKDVLTSFISLVVKRIEDLDKPLSMDRLNILKEITKVFDQDISKYFDIEPDKKILESVEERVKRYYGVD